MFSKTRDVFIFSVAFLPSSKTLSSASFCCVRPKVTRIQRKTVISGSILKILRFSFSPVLMRSVEQLEPKKISGYQSKEFEDKAKIPGNIEHCVRDITCTQMASQFERRHWTAFLSSFSCWFRTKKSHYIVAGFRLLVQNLGAVLDSSRLLYNLAYV